MGLFKLRGGSAKPPPPTPLSLSPSVAKSREGGGLFREEKQMDAQAIKKKKKLVGCDGFDMVGKGSFIY